MAAVNSAFAAQAVGPLAMATTAGDGSVQVKDDKLEGKLRNHGESTSLQIGRAKKRIESDLTHLTDSTTKRIKLDTEGVRVDSEDEERGVQCMTASKGQMKCWCMAEKTANLLEMLVRYHLYS